MNLNTQKLIPRTPAGLLVLFLWCLLLPACAPRGGGAASKTTPTATALPQKEGTALAIDSLITPDPALEALILPYKKRLASSLDSVIGYSARELVKNEVESALGNFVADLTLEAAQKISPVPVDLALITIGGLRVPLPQGPITIGVIYELMPFENTLVVLRLTGEQTRQLFEFAAEKKIAAIANSKMLVKAGKPLEIMIGGKPFDPDRSYTLATSDYLAGGGDNLVMLPQAERLLHTDLLVRTAIMQKILALHKAGKQVDPPLEGRIKIVE